MNRLKPIFAVWSMLVAVAIIALAGCSQENGPPISALTEEEGVLPTDLHFFVICFANESAQARGLQQKEIDQLLGSGCELLGDDFDADGQMHRLALRLPEAVSSDEVVAKLRAMQGVVRVVISSLVC